MIYNQWDVAIVPFPFVDEPKSKNRPVLLISNNRFNQDNNMYIASMVTSAEHSEMFGGTIITDIESAGLKKPSLIRLKLFTLDHQLIKETIGILSEKDKEEFQHNLKTCLK